MKKTISIILLLLLAPLYAEGLGFMRGIEAESLTIPLDQYNVNINHTNLGTLIIEGHPFLSLRIKKSQINKIIIRNSNLRLLEIDELSSLQKITIESSHLGKSVWPKRIYKLISHDLRTTGVAKSFKEAISLGVKISGLTKDIFLYDHDSGVCLNGHGKRGHNSKILGECSLLTGNLFSKSNPLPRGIGHNFGTAQTTLLSGKGIRIKSQEIQPLTIEKELIYGVEFIDSNSQGLRIIGSELQKIRFSGTTLEGVQIVDAQLSNSVAVSSNFDRCVVKNSIIVDLYSAETKFNNCQMTNSLIQMTAGKETVIRESNMKGSKLIVRNSELLKLENVDLRGADLSSFTYEELKNSCRQCLLDSETLLPPRSPELNQLPETEFRH